LAIAPRSVLDRKAGGVIDVETTSMSTSNIESTIRNFLVTSFGYRGATADLGSEVALLDQGILDSTAVLEIVQFLEQDLGIQVADEEMVPENFGSIARLVTYVSGKKSSN
jgi:acyl carrier protein